MRSLYYTHVGKHSNIWIIMMYEKKNKHIKDVKKIDFHNNNTKNISTNIKEN